MGPIEEVLPVEMLGFQRECEIAVDAVVQNGDFDSVGSMSKRGVDGNRPEQYSGEDVEHDQNDRSGDESNRPCDNTPKP